MLAICNVHICQGNLQATTNSCQLLATPKYAVYIKKLVEVNALAHIHKYIFI